MSSNDSSGLSRRGLFRAGAGAAAAVAASSAASTAYAQEEFDYGGWFDNVPNFEGTVDMTGQDEVVVTVGPGGDLLFAPPAIHVDPGTTVVWEWEQGFHNVAEKETGERYASELTGEVGTTYEVTFESDGISTYVCEPHRGQGMKGAVAVGNGEGTPDITEGETVVGGPEDGGSDGGSEGGENGGSEGGEGSDGGESGGGSEEQPPALRVDSDIIALYGLAGVIAFLSPFGLIFLMYRNMQDEQV
ncbi:halocyanin domain-containing protein [Natronomonas halophila]|uniref:halocyanin domain-containing protein n=1 Tax=Natronomonas halophila TaxID=2747817 RepID=UPI0015B3FECF|nr:halocyanin domain-containing protein [Natronomonas halophila]QLD85568.1 halocyanin domain-containing protein [Natronomonas halophila]